MTYSIPRLSRETPVFVLTVQWVANPLCTYTVLGIWLLEIVIRWGKPYLARLDKYPRKPKYPAL
jgi:hypothetical protein